MVEAKNIVIVKSTNITSHSLSVFCQQAHGQALNNHHDAGWKYTQKKKKSMPEAKQQHQHQYHHQHSSLQVIHTGEHSKITNISTCSELVSLTTSPKSASG